MAFNLFEYLFMMFSFLEERDRVLLLFSNLSFMSWLLFLLFVSLLFLIMLFLLLFTFDIFEKLSAVRYSR